MNLTWSVETAFVCPRCAGALSGRGERLELQLPFEVVEIKLELFSCPSCKDGHRFGGLHALEDGLWNATDHSNGSSVELFEISSFATQSRWLEAHVQCLDECLPWTAFAFKLEEASEIAEARSIRARFGPTEDAADDGQNGPSS
jgi:hypothetical protein